MTMSVRNAVNALRGDVNQVRNDLSNLTSELGALAHLGTQETKERFSARVVGLQHRASALQKYIGRGFDDGVGYLDDHVHEKPYQTAILVGVVTGVLAWLIMRPRDERDL